MAKLNVQTSFNLELTKEEINVLLTGLNLYHEHLIRHGTGDNTPIADTITELREELNYYGTR